MNIPPVTPKTWGQVYQGPKEQSELQTAAQQALAQIPAPIQTRAVKQTLSGRVIWQQGQSRLDAFKAALHETVVYHGPGVQHGQTAPPQSQIAEIVDYLLGKGTPSRAWLNWKHVNGIFLSKDRELLKGMQQEFRRVLQEASTQLPKPGSPEEIVFQGFIGNIVALLPYSYPQRGTTFPIPQKVNGEWKVFDYQVNEVFKMSPRFFSTPIRAYGLTASGASPLISFLGTTYPSGKGFLATLLADFTPGFSVGHVPYLYGEKALQQWMRDKTDIHLYGMSLGGSLAFHTLRNNREKIAEVDVYNPAGLYGRNWRESYNDIPVRVYYQDNDLVATMGYFPTGTGVSIYRVLPEESENSLKAHARVYTGAETVTLLKSTPEYENGRLPRRLLTLMHQLFSPLVFIPTLISQFLYLLITSPRNIVKGLSR